MCLPALPIAKLGFRTYITAIQKRESVRTIIDHSPTVGMVVGASRTVKVVVVVFITPGLCPFATVMLTVPAVSRVPAGIDTTNCVADEEVIGSETVPTVAPVLFRSDIVAVVPINRFPIMVKRVACVVLGVLVADKDVIIGCGGFTVVVKRASLKPFMFVSLILPEMVSGWGGTLNVRLPLVFIAVTTGEVVIRVPCAAPLATEIDERVARYKPVMRICVSPLSVNACSI
jgi:hypothetical protein